MRATNSKKASEKQRPSRTSQKVGAPHFFDTTVGGKKAFNSRPGNFYYISGKIMLSHFYDIFSIFSQYFVNIYWMNLASFSSIFMATHTNHS